MSDNQDKDSQIRGSVEGSQDNRNKDIDRQASQQFSNQNEANSRSRDNVDVGSKTDLDQNRPEEEKEEDKNSQHSEHSNRTYERPETPPPAILLDPSTIPPLRYRTLNWNFFEVKTHYIKKDTIDSYCPKIFAFYEAKFREELKTMQEEKDKNRENCQQNQQSQQRDPFTPLPEDLGYSELLESRAPALSKMPMMPWSVRLIYQFFHYLQIEPPSIQTVEYLAYKNDQFRENELTLDKFKNMMMALANIDTRS